MSASAPPPPPEIDGEDVSPGGGGDAPFEDSSLLSFAPTRLWEVLLSAAIVVALGIAAIVFARTVVRMDLSVPRVVIPAFGITFVAAGITGGLLGVRAYLTFAERDVARFADFQMMSLWTISALLLVLTILDPRSGALVLGVAFWGPLLIVERVRWPNRDAPRGAVRLLRRLMIGECVVGFIGPLAALPIAVAMHVSDEAASAYVTNVIVVPALSVAAFVIVRRRTRPLRAP